MERAERGVHGFRVAAAFVEGHGDGARLRQQLLALLEIELFSSAKSSNFSSALWRMRYCYWQIRRTNHQLLWRIGLGDPAGGTGDRPFWRISGDDSVVTMRTGMAEVCGLVRTRSVIIRPSITGMFEVRDDGMYLRLHRRSSPAWPSSASTTS